MTFQKQIIEIALKTNKYIKKPYLKNDFLSIKFLHTSIKFLFTFSRPYFYIKFQKGL